MRRYSKWSPHTWVVTDIHSLIHFKIPCDIRTHLGHSATKIPALPLTGDLNTITTMGFCFFNLKVNPVHESSVNSHLNHYPVPHLVQYLDLALLLLFCSFFISLAHNRAARAEFLSYYQRSDNIQWPTSSALLNWPHACCDCEMNCLFHIDYLQKRTLVIKCQHF